METKLLALKAITWSSKKYKEPCNEIYSKGYVTERGFGHEEWNNSPNRVLDGERYFHTEFTDTLESFGESGDLGILMFANHQGGDFLVGVAVNVFTNDTKRMKSAASTFGLQGMAKELWQLESVRQGEKNTSLKIFSEHWEKNWHFIKWRCPEQSYIWFEIPVQISPADFTNASRLNHHHSSYQTIRAEDAVTVLINRAKVGKRHPIIKWLTHGEFEQPKAHKSKQSRKHAGGGGPGGAPCTDKAYTRYVEKQEIEVSPYHGILQRQFCQYLNNRGLVPQPDIERVDVRYKTQTDSMVFAEIKPAQKSEARYAIRLAMGQLLDYRQGEKTSPLMLIVISEKPHPKDLSLAKENGFGVAYKRGSTFVEVWPD